ncbi:suppressor of fused domain protein [Novosphingobium sp. 9]|uniref:suppressor of fused domain protein n=1 Tax=Novosphingobium sp. 9 TaxID=2025349 RepID=UPI00391F6E5C
MPFQVCWLIPVTSDEIDYRKEHGTDALEELFETRQFDYSDPFRASVVELSR